MMRTISVGLVACLGLALWSQPMNKDDLSSLSREQLQQLREQLKEQEMQLLRICSQEEEKAGKAFEEYEKRSLLQTDLPQPSLADRMVLVRIVGIRRVDEEVWRVEPWAPRKFPYYELRAQVVKSWMDYYSVAHDFGLPVKAGDILHLLWMGCKRVEGGREVPAPLIWEVGEHYLVPKYYPLVKVPYDERVPENMAQETLSWEKVWLAVRSGECLFSPLGDDLTANIRFRTDPEEIVLQVPFLPVVRIEEPFEEQVQVLDEEAPYFRLPTPEQRIQWAKQRVQNTQLPLWKRQRALLYLYLATDPHYLEDTQRMQLRTSLRQQFPDEKPEVGYKRFRSRRVMDYLTYLQGLSEPLLQAFGLRIVKQYEGLYSQAPAEEIERWVKVLEPFLEAARPPEVRREAAAVLAEELDSLVFHETEGPDRVKASEADWAWLRSYAEVLRGRWEREQDKVVRVYLARAWTGLLSIEVRSQLWRVERRLRELERGGR
ncbi:MAG: hypothetical protein KatS3mg016_1117 [Fimbriimonadales bacterium]|nr:MAG: hypothetical protein KatS3mg016_1117 [Fimbriimonadales bacterium]